MLQPSASECQVQQEHLRHRAQECLSAGQHELAEKLFRELRDNAPFDSGARNGLIQSLVGLDRMKDAYQEAQQMTKHWELYVQAKIWLAWLSEVAQEATNARRHLEDAVRFVPEDTNAKVALFEHYFRAENWFESELVLQDLLLQWPDYAPARCNLGTVWLREGKLEKARAVYEDVLELDVENAIARENLAYLNRLLPREADAMSSHGAKESTIR